LPVQIYPNCDGDDKDGNYTLHIGWTYGYEIKDSYELSIAEISKDVCVGKKKSKTTNKKFIYELVSKPDDIKNGERFDIEVKITNNANTATNIEIWSYVYKGNKAYSGDREENKKTLTVYAMDSSIVKLSNMITEAKPGSYKIKVRIKKDDLKTFKEITEVIEVVDEEEEKGLVLWNDNREIYSLLGSLGLVESDNEAYEKALERYQALAGDDSLCNFNMHLFTEDEKFLETALEKYPSYAPAIAKKAANLMLEDTREAKFLFALASQCYANSTVLDLDSFYRNFKEPLERLFQKV